MLCFNLNNSMDLCIKAIAFVVEWFETFYWMSKTHHITHIVFSFYHADNFRVKLLVLVFTFTHLICLTFFFHLITSFCFLIIFFETLTLWRYNNAEVESHTSHHIREFTLTSNTWPNHVRATHQLINRMLIFKVLFDYV